MGPKVTRSTLVNRFSCAEAHMNVSMRGSRGGRTSQHLMLGHNLNGVMAFAGGPIMARF